MFKDKLTIFSSSQAVTAAANSTNNFKMSGTPVARDLFTGHTLWMVTTIDTALTDGGSNTGTTVALQTSSDDITYTAVQTLYTLIQAAPATTTLATTYFARISPLTTDSKYINIRYTPTGANLTGGTISTFIVTDINLWKAKPKGYTITAPSRF